MARLIDADSAKMVAEYIEQHLVAGDSEFLQGYLAGIKEMANGLAKMPPVDAAPVVHGRWEPELMPTGVEYSGWAEMTVQALSCSVCGKCIDVSEGYFSYCPNCGANMMGGGKDDGNE